LNKSELRKKIKKSLSLIDRDLIKIKEDLLARNLLTLLNSLDVFSDKIVIGLFAPIKDEVNIISFLKEHNKRMAFPSINNSSEMVFKKSTYENLEIKRDFKVDILGPNDSALEVEPDILLVPGLAFGRAGERLGRGRGYYDKYLDKFNNITIGLGLSDQVIEDIPMEEHDCFLNWIVTDKEVIKI
jgi:5-formyltetrahydrofolate cyclo-ligase